MGVKLITSMFTNGKYDWLIHFNANNIRDAKLFVESLSRIFGEYLDETVLLEKLFMIENCGIPNPEMKKLRDFYPDL